MTDYALTVLTLTGIFAILSVSYTLLPGYVDLVTMCQAAFFGIGAYVSAGLTLQYGLNFVPAMLLGAVLAGIISLGVAIPSIRIHSDYFTIATLGFEFAIYYLMLNLTGLTGGAYGIKHLPQFDLVGYTFDSAYSQLALVAVFVVIVGLACARIGASPFGRVLKAMGEDEVASKALGKNTLRNKITIVAISAGFAAISGSLYAHYMRFIIPDNFNIHQSFLILCMALLGGMGSIRGAIIGAAILFGLPQVMSFLDIPIQIAGASRQIIYGAILVVLMIFRPQGILGKGG